MTRILHVDASIKGPASVSRRLTARIVERLVAADPAAAVTARDLSEGVPQIDGDWLAAVYGPAEARTAGQVALAAYSDTLMAEVKAADVLVIGLPVYNFALPAQLKSWLDHLARRGLSFTYSEAGPQGLLTGKKAIVALASDGTRIGSEIDFASGYLRHMLNFFGITDVEFIAADALVFGAEAIMGRAEAEIDAIAA